MADPQLGRIEGTAVAACLVMAAVAWPLAGPWAALAVLGGGVLSAVSYASLASGVSALTAFAGRAARGPGAGGRGEPAGEPADGPPERPEETIDEPLEARKTAPVRARTLLKVAGRYALLVLLAYVMIARLRLHPVGVLAGLSSVVVAVGIEALRIVVKKP
jgi:hypothetical protein